jgi:hypothetical protein
MGATFLQMKLVVDRGGGRMEHVLMELSLPQFYDLLANLVSGRVGAPCASSE